MTLPRPWHCHPLGLRCIAGHRLTVSRADRSSIAVVHGSAQLALQCLACRPATYAFADLVGGPDAHATLYAITEDQYRWFVTGVHLTTLELLAEFGYRPSEAA